jgi:hypothetical protein
MKKRIVVVIETDKTGKYCKCERQFFNMCDVFHKELQDYGVGCPDKLDYIRCKQCLSAERKKLIAR